MYPINLKKLTYKEGFINKSLKKEIISRLQAVHDPKPFNLSKEQVDEIEEGIVAYNRTDDVHIFIYKIGCFKLRQHGTKLVATREWTSEEDPSYSPKQSTHYDYWINDTFLAFACTKSKDIYQLNNLYVSACTSDYNEVFPFMLTNHYSALKEIKVFNNYPNRNFVQACSGHTTNGFTIGDLPRIAFQYLEGASNIDLWNSVRTGISGTNIYTPVLKCPEYNNADTLHRWFARLTYLHSFIQTKEQFKKFSNYFSLEEIKLVCIQREIDPFIELIRQTKEILKSLEDKQGNTLQDFKNLL